ncbi:uncharacterized protein LOC142790844 [Rhipicephalus microplus]|uniref:uncharacterized protein LOC142790844 n=1 Tax=Rhipicephalus microplus TaxID=6941 RepID=UPI003F6BC0A4
MRIALLALAVVAVAFVCLEVQLAGGMRIKVPKVKLSKGAKLRVSKMKLSRVGMKRVKVPKVKVPRVKMPRVRGVGKAIAHGANGAVNVVSQLGNTGATIAQTVLSNQSQKNQTSSR